MDTTTAPATDIIERALSFWLGQPGADGRLERRDIWFESTAAFDDDIRTRFLADHDAAAAGRLEHLKETPDGCLALILLLDQFPRNMFRGQARAFATDARARAVTYHVLEEGWDQDQDPIKRMFFYITLEHSEDLEDQDLSLAVFADIVEDNERWKFAVERHHEIIARFGRFPHRNEALGRTSTAAELAFLTEPDSSF